MERDIVMWVGMTLRQAYVISWVAMRVRSGPNAVGGGRLTQ
jgi:hypothetical protein